LKIANGKNLLRQWIKDFLMTNKLWVFGDSFSFLFEGDKSERIWLLQAASKLNYSIVNYSLRGCSQDFTWQVMQQEKDKITPDDQVLVVLTNPSRYWLFEEEPDHTIPRLFKEEKPGVDSRIKAAELFFRYIQRPQLDVLSVINRLGWLDHTATRNGWKKPLVVLGFGQYYGEDSDFPGLKFSYGDLTSISMDENEDNKDASLFNGAEPRYNHLCLSNHDILAEKIYNTLANDEKLDLTTGFKKGIFNKTTARSRNLAEKEFSLALHLGFLNATN
jgi:hypothetical protein